MRTRVATTVVVGALVLIGAACGDDGPTNAPPAMEAEPDTPDTTVPIDGPGATTTSTTTDAAAPTTAPPNGVVVEVIALDNSFRPQRIEIEAGTTVRFENRGRNDHNVLPADGSDDWGVEVVGFAPGDVHEFTFGVPGEYAYYCSLHGTATVGMVGTVVVTD